MKFSIYVNFGGLGVMDLAIYAQLRVYIDGVLRLSRNSRLAYVNEQTFWKHGWSTSGIFPDYDSGIPLDYTYPSYRSSSTVLVRMRIYGHINGEGNYEDIDWSIDERDCAVGTLSRIG